MSTYDDQIKTIEKIIESMIVQIDTCKHSLIDLKKSVHTSSFVKELIEDFKTKNKNDSKNYFDFSFQVALSLSLIHCSKLPMFFLIFEFGKKFADDELFSKIKNEFYSYQKKISEMMEGENHDKH